MAEPVTEFEKYRNEILGKLGNDDPVTVLSATLQEVTALVDNKSAEQLRRQPALGEWSAWEVLSHLADSEAVFGVRIRMVVTQDQPSLVGYDQDAWTARFASLDSEPQETVTRWQMLRRDNLRLYESLTGEEWDRVGLHSERGPQTVREIVALLAGHDPSHIEQIRRCLSVY